MGTIFKMLPSHQEPNPHKSAETDRTVDSRGSWQQRGSTFLLRHRRFVLPVMVVVLAAVEAIKLTLFGPHPDPIVLIIDLLLFGLVALLVVLLIAALSHSEVERARSQELAAASVSERRQIAQNLHDTLAQNLSYLCLKLDQLAGENPAEAKPVDCKDLAQMRSAAEEAYRQMRVTLDELNPMPQQDLLGMLKKQSSMIAERAGIDLRTSQIGTPYMLPGPIRQQILFIIREALHNVEKHARARCLHVQMVWLENELIIKVTDDGVGFDPSTASEDGHYGLWIMQHRAIEIGGAVTIQPADGQGTEVTLWVPRQDIAQPKRTKPIARSAGCEY